MDLGEIPDINACPWQVIRDLQAFGERARYRYDNGDKLNALSELAVLNAILRDHAGWCVPDMSDDEKLGNLVGKILAHTKTLMHSIELETGETFTGISGTQTTVSLSATNPARGKCTLKLAGPVGAEVVVRLYAVSGRLVDTLFDGRLVDGTETMLWDGYGADGRPVASGAYFAMAESDGLRQAVKLIYIR